VRKFADLRPHGLTECQYESFGKDGRTRDRKPLSEHGPYR
jgi:hypothetical protein